MSANKSLAGEAPEKPDDLSLTLDIVDGYGIKLVLLTLLVLVQHESSSSGKEC